MNIELRTEQKQLLSAKMIQSTEILQMTALDLSSYLEEVALENPVIDLVPPSASDSLDSETLKQLRTMERQSSVSYSSEVPESEESSDDWKYGDNQEENLAEYLWAQLLTSGLPEADLHTLHYMLYCLDERGYLEDSMEALSGHCHLPEGELTRLLSVLQALDPAGVGARDLKECLLLQVERLGLSNLILEELIRSHLDAIAKNQLPALRSYFGCTMEELSQHIETIRSLNPKPGMAYCDRRQLSYLTPDVTVVKFQEHYEILLSESRYPEIQINDYYARLAQSTDSPEVINYLSHKLSQAEWLRTCVAQRSQTLLRITQAIVTFQKDFFARGKSYMKPLRLAEVAEAAGVHESTVSRAVRGKYLQCMWGIYPLNYFFPKSIFLKETEDTTDISLDVKQALKTLIQEEDKKKPFSDRILAEQLAAQGFSISRRTVAKYRNLLGIGDTASRKDHL